MTMQEIYDKVMASDELKKSFVEAAKDKDKLSAWLKEQGCTNTIEEVGEFLKAQQNKSGELSDDELESVAGGEATSGSVTSDVMLSVFTAGIGCAAVAIVTEHLAGDSKVCFDNINDMDKMVF